MSEGSSIKIAFVSQPIDPVLPTFKNSMGVLIDALARRLARSCDVVVYTKVDQGPKVYREDGITYRRITMLDDFRKLNPAFKFLRRLRGAGTPAKPRFASILFHVDYAIQVAWDLRKRKCDVVHIINFSQLAPIIRAFNPGIRIVLHMQCQWLSQLDRRMIGRRLKNVDLIIGCCNYITDRVGKAFPQYSARCRTVYNGVDLSLFNPDNGNGQSTDGTVMRLLFVGRISPEKGLHVLIDAMPTVLQRFPETHLTIVGPKGTAPKLFIVSLSDDERVAGLAEFYERGDYFSQLQERIDSLDLARNLTFAGPVAHEQLAAHYRNADVLVIPSFSEAFPIVLVEGMSSQVPSVAARVGGIEEVFQNGRQVGVIVEAGDASALAEGILRLLSDERLRWSMGRAARQAAVDLFSWDSVTDTILDHDRSLCCDGK